VLTDDEIVRLVSIAVHRLGIRTIRLTGGEPLLRPGLVSLVERITNLDPSVEVSMTTNGVGLARRAADLKAAGLHRVNVSLDTLNEDRYRRITGRDRLHDVLEGLVAARSAGLDPVKINAVPILGINDDEIADLAAFALDHGYEPRFIESMPLDAQGAWTRDLMVPAEQILQALSERFALTPVERSGAPAETWTVAGTTMRIGVIASVTRPFCGTCDRVRLTADGQLRNCLFATQESDLRRLLRAGTSDQDIAAAWRVCVGTKAAGHLINTPEFEQPLRPMSAIGG
jgi:cyclic pyranopterin phosphate synthase